MKYYVLYNPNSNNSKGEENARAAARGCCDVVFDDVTAIGSYADYLANMEKNSALVICGGDGTLNRFVNDCAGIKYPEKVLYAPTGTGNDFANDLGIRKRDGLSDITQFIKDLPVVEVNGCTRYFLNGVSLGMDGFCCVEGERRRLKYHKPVNYTWIALYSLLFGYKPANARITVDGETNSYGKVWIAPTMLGRFYGGGMMPAPDQRRNSEDKTLSVIVWHGSGKLKTLTYFPNIYKGRHTRFVKMCSVKRGRVITVEFDEPCAMQIDGEPVQNVTKYTVYADGSGRDITPSDVFERRTKAGSHHPLKPHAV